MSKERNQTDKERNIRKITDATRANFRPVSKLKIPEAVRAYFRERGFELTWVRCIDPKTRTFDTSRIAMKYEIGGGIVTPKEMMEIDRGFLYGKTKFRYDDEFSFSEERRSEEFGIRSDDSVLCKIPLEWSEQKRIAREQAAQEELQSLPDQIRKNGGEISQMKFGSNKARVNRSENFFE